MLSRFILLTLIIILARHPWTAMPKWHWKYVVYVGLYACRRVWVYVGAHVCVFFGIDSIGHSVQSPVEIPKDMRSKNRWLRHAGGLLFTGDCWINNYLILTRILYICQRRNTTHSFFSTISLSSFVLIPLPAIKYRSMFQESLIASWQIVQKC